MNFLSKLAAKPFLTGAPLSASVCNGRLIAIGASTGGTEAMAKLFHLFPTPLPGIVVVQHMPPVFTQMYADRLNKELPFTVTEAKDNVRVMPNTIHIAPGDRHLQIERRGTQIFTRVGGQNKVNGHCPSVDVLFNSCAEVYGRLALGIILTGMGADGATGLLNMRRKGSFTIGQDEESCVVYGMPKKAFDYGAVEKQASLTLIPTVMLQHLREADGGALAAPC
jgi:two-component system chemotaxis response regulator CheB